MDSQKTIELTRQRLKKARRIAVLTGAGVSAESGVPTFRGADGMWKQRNAMDLATPQAFAKDPRLVWEFYNWRRELISKVAPNPAHFALARLEEAASGFALITQNVDGLHTRAGSVNTLEIHGSLWRVRCTACGKESENHTVPLPELPSCEACGGLLRPAVVWFGEALDPTLLNDAIQAARLCDVMLVAGTSAVVQPAASLAMMAREAGAFTVEINLERTVQSGGVDVALTGKAGELLPLLVDEGPLSVE